MSSKWQRKCQSKSTGKREDVTSDEDEEAAITAPIPVKAMKGAKFQENP